MRMFPLDTFLSKNDRYLYVYYECPGPTTYLGSWQIEHPEKFGRFWPKFKPLVLQWTPYGLCQS